MMMKLLLIIFLTCVFALSNFAKELKLDVAFLMGDEVKISAHQKGIILGIYIFLDRDDIIYSVMEYAPEHRVGHVSEKTLIAIQKEGEKTSYKKAGHYETIRWNDN